MTHSQTNAAKDKVDPMAAAMKQMIAANPMQEGVLKTMHVIGTETLRFLSSRMQQDLETQKAMLACKSLQDLQTVQADFYKTAMEDYRAAASRMMGVMSAASTDGVGSALSAAKRGYDDVPV